MLTFNTDLSLKCIIIKETDNKTEQLKLLNSIYWQAILQQP